MLVSLLICLLTVSLAVNAVAINNNRKQYLDGYRQGEADNQPPF